MALSDDLLDLEALVAAARDGGPPIAGDALQRLLLALGRAADRADDLERRLSRSADTIRRLSDTLATTADQLSPVRDRDAVEAAVASGKLVVLAAHRVERLPVLDPFGGFP